MNNSLLAKALKYAEFGWHVIPLYWPAGNGCSCKNSECRSPAKHPLTTNGLKDGTLDREQIIQWWTKWPEANIGLCTGAGSQMITLDVDPRHGGDVSLKKLEEQYGKLPLTPTALTGGGGFHHLFQHPQRYVKNSEGIIAKGLDMRGDGGYIVAPPSKHISGQCYTWKNGFGPSDIQLAEAPEWLLKLNSAEKKSNTVSAKTSGVITEGQRNSSLASLAGSMRARGMSEDSICKALLSENTIKCSPPLDESEVKGIAHSISKYEPLSDCESAITRWLNLDETDVRDIIPILKKAGKITYEIYRKRISKKANIREKILDEEVIGSQKVASEENPERVMFNEPEPWSESVNGLELLNEIESLLARYIVLPDGASTVIPLWVLHTYAHAAANISPIMLISSPTKRCGKTTLLSLLQAIVNRPISASNITPAATFRAIDKWNPTLLIDEMDTFLHEHNELRGIINSGHKRDTAQLIRTEGDNHEPRKFSTWAPKAMAMIGLPHPTLIDRSIIIQLRRKRKGEEAERLKLDRLQDVNDIRRRAMRWVEDNSANLLADDPIIPTQLNDRAADNWEPLLAIADVVGGVWPKKARDAALILNDNENDDTGDVTLLQDVRRLFEERCTSNFASADLVQWLIGMEDRPWPEWYKGKPITARQIAQLLKPFGIEPKNIRIGNDKVLKGYAKEQFADAFTRYLPDLSATPLHDGNHSELSTFQSATDNSNVADKNEFNSLEDKECSAVADDSVGERLDDANVELQERAAIMEFDGGLCREEAEGLARIIFDAEGVS